MVPQEVRQDDDKGDLGPRQLELALRMHARGHEGVCETETTNERTPHTPIEHLWFTIQVYYPDETYRGMPGRHRPSTRDEAHRKRRPSVCPEELDAISKRQKDPHKWHHPTSRRSTDASSPGIRLRTHQGFRSA